VVLPKAELLGGEPVEQGHQAEMDEQEPIEYDKLSWSAFHHLIMVQVLKVFESLFEVGEGAEALFSDLLVLRLSG